MLNLRAGFGIAVEDTDCRAFFEEAGSGGGSDAAGASSDEHTFSG
jgi:hypothetical protein